MEKLKLQSAIELQIKYCMTFDGYKCGIYVNSTNAKYVNEVLQEIIKNISDESVLKYNFKCIVPFIYFTNNSNIKIIVPSDSARGYRINGSIIDNDISLEVKNTIIYPKIIPRILGKYNWESMEDVRKRILTVEIEEVK